MTPGTFRRARIEELPTYLAGKQGAEYEGALGDVQDAELRKLKDAVLMRNPVDCPDDGLDAVGRFYDLPRLGPSSGEFEYDDMFRTRLQAAWAAAFIDGSPSAIPGALHSPIQNDHAFWFADVAVYEAWQWLASDAWWSAFWVVVGPSMPWSVQAWDSFSWGNGTTWGSTATTQELRAVIRQILKRKDAASMPAALVLDFTDPLWGVFEWDGADWGGGQSLSIRLVNRWAMQPGWGDFRWGNANDWWEN